MSINLGLDFGTTYTIASVMEKDAETGRISLRTCNYTKDEFRIDSIAVVDQKGKVVFGQRAREKMGIPNRQVFRGFKMLIGEKNESLKEKNHYTIEITPEKLTSDFFGDIIKTINGRYNEDEAINKLVVGVPAIWSSDESTVDRNALLRDIIRNNKDISVNDIEIVTEPAAACAFCANKFKERNGKNFVGKMIVIDYGGGTLDITLCDVSENGNNSTVLDMATIGQGWNTEGRIGKAGLSFMEEVTKLLFVKDYPNIEQLPSFYELVGKVETIIIRNAREIKEIFEENDGSDYTAITEEIDDEIIFDDKEYCISCGILAQAFDNIIREVLLEQLNQLKKLCEERFHINLMDAVSEDNVKIILVGGFNSFYLTQKTIFEFLSAMENDNRFNIFLDVDERENAISFGATLIANNVIGFERAMPYHLGLGLGKPMTRENDGYLTRAFYAIKKGEKLEPDKEYFISDREGEPILFSGSSIPLFVRNYNDDETIENEKLFYGLEKRFAQRVKLNNECTPFKIAFSLDRSMVITIHIYTLKDTNDLNSVIDTAKIELSKIDDLIGALHVIRRN